MLSLLAANPKEPSPCCQARRPPLSRGHTCRRLPDPTLAMGRMALRMRSGPAAPSSRGALLPRASVPTPGSPGCSPGGATGTGHGQLGPLGPRQGAVQQRDKAPQ